MAGAGVVVSVGHSDATGDPAYNRPRGFIEVTRENLGTWVSPHFRLAQFVCKPCGNRNVCNR